jgi:phospholipid/cholesterol/gamma-HCH transport system ATP-binding protein
MSAAPVLLSIRGLRNVRDGRVIHEGLDLDVRRGETLVLLGGSGSGKTTLLRTLVGLDAPTAGSCTFDGTDLFSLPPAAWPRMRTRIAYAFQGGALFDSLTVRENLEFPLREHRSMSASERRQRILEQLDALGLGRIEGLMPAELSGGMQKRVGVARATILDPQLVLYDEPTAGLDPENVRRINDLILRLKGFGQTAVVVTHDAACALAVADRFAFLANGRVEVEQTRADFERSPDPRLAGYFEGAPPRPALQETSP